MGRGPPPQTKALQAGRGTTGVTKPVHMTSSTGRPSMTQPAIPRQRREMDPRTGRQVMKIQGPDWEPG